MAEGGLRLPRRLKARLRLARRLRAGSASPHDRTLILHKDEHRVRQDIRVNHDIEGNALCAYRKVPSGYDGMGAFGPFHHNSAQIVLWSPTFVPQCSRRRLQSSGADTNIGIRQPLRFKTEITSSTVIDVWSLPRLLPEGSQLCPPARCTVRRRRMELELPGGVDREVTIRPSL